MSRKAVFAGLITMIVLQLAVLITEYAGAMYPLWTGREVRLNTVPVDPRSMFRGNYARLKYDMSMIKKADLERTEFRAGEVVYTRLKSGEKGVYMYDGVELERPQDGVFIRGRITCRYYGDTCDVSYGIEAYFAPKKKALALERKLRQGGLAVVMLAENGKATLKDVIPAKK